MMERSSSSSISSSSLSSSSLDDYINEDFIISSSSNFEFAEDAPVTKWGKKFHRKGKAFSYTFWRTQIEDEIFWSIQGHNDCGSVWLVTQYFGPPEEARRYQQEITMHHPTEAKIKIDYSSVCTEGRNCIKISREIMKHFRNKDNSFNFDFRIVKLKRNPYPHRTM